MTHSSPAATSNKPKKKWILIVSPILITLFGFIINSSLSGMAKPPEKKVFVNKAPIIEVLDVTKQDVTFDITSQGTVVPRTETTLISEVSGQITFVSEKFLVGGYFQKGEVILKIDPITYDVALLQVQSRLEAMQAELIQEKARANQAEQEWLLTGKTLKQAPILALRIPQYQKALADVKAAEADVLEAKIKLSRTAIVAPYDALVNEKHVDIGQYVSVASKLAKTIAIDYAEIRLPIKQRDIEFVNLPKINKANKVDTQVEIYNKQGGQRLTWQSTIHRYEGVVDQQSRVHYVVAQITDPYNLKAENSNDAELRVGSFVKANIQGKSVKNLLSMPRYALRGANQLHLIDSDNKLHIVTVDVVRTQKNIVFIDAEMAAGMRVISTKLETPVEGMLLRVLGEFEVAPAESPEIEKDDEVSTSETQVVKAHTPETKTVEG